MHARGKRDTVAPSMERYRDFVRRCQLGNLYNFGNTADARHVGLDEVDGAADYKIIECVVGMQIFADGNRGSAPLAQNRVAFDVFDEKRLFEPVSTAGCERVGRF